MIHIVSGSRYDGHFERVADRIAAALTPETRRTILQLKFETPDDEKIAGKLKNYKKGLAKKIVDANEKLAQVKYPFKTN